MSMTTENERNHVKQHTELNEKLIKVQNDCEAKIEVMRKLMNP